MVTKNRTTKSMLEILQRHQKASEQWLDNYVKVVPGLAALAHGGFIRSEENHLQYQRDYPGLAAWLPDYVFKPPVRRSSMGYQLVRAPEICTTLLEVHGS